MMRETSLFWLAATTMSCGTPKLTCGDPAVLAAVRQLQTAQWAKDVSKAPNAFADFETTMSRVTLDYTDFMTEETNSKVEVSCKAFVSVKAGGVPFGQHELSYSARRTDDSRDLVAAATPVEVPSPEDQIRDWWDGKRTSIQNGAYGAARVDKEVSIMPGSPQPRYPASLKSAEVEGEVEVAFVVDSTGRVDTASVKVLKSSNDLFTGSVKAALANTRFRPAVARGNRVSQWVRQPYEFNIIK
jgi:TonB family protein